MREKTPQEKMRHKDGIEEEDFYRAWNAGQVRRVSDGQIMNPQIKDAPSQRPWVGLTDGEVQFYIKKHSKLVNAGYDKMTDTNLVAKTFDSTSFYKEVSTVLKERNT